MTMGSIELTCLNVILVASSVPSWTYCRYTGDDVSAVPESSASVKVDFDEMEMTFGVFGFCGVIVTIDVSVNSAAGCCTTTGSNSILRGIGSGGVIGTEQIRFVAASGVFI